MLQNALSFVAVWEAESLQSRVYFHIGFAKTLGRSLSNIWAGVGAGLHCFEPAMGFCTVASKG